MTSVAAEQALQMINECFEIGVASEAMDDVAPELNPGKGSSMDEHVSRSTVYALIRSPL